MSEPTVGAAAPGHGVGASFFRLGAGEAIARLVAFGVAVVLARRLGASVYGVIVLASTVLLYLSVITDCGAGFLGVRLVVAEAGKLPDTVRAVLGARLLVAVGAFTLAGVLSFALLPAREAAIVSAYALTLFTVALGTRWVHVGLGQTTDAATGRIVAELATAVAVVALVRGAGDIDRVPLAQMIGEGIGALLLLHRLPSALRRVRLAVRPDVLRDLLRQSWPLVLHALLGLAIFNSDMVFLRAFRDSTAVGIYAAAYALVSFGLNLGAAYTMSLLPVMTRLRDDRPGARALHDTSMLQVLAGGLPVAVGGFLVAGPLVALVFGASYRSAAIPLQILIWSLPIALVRNVSQGVLLAYARQHEMMRSAAWAAGVNVVLNVALIPRWGMTGAAASTLLTELLRTVIAGAFVQRQGIPMTPAHRFVRIAVATILMGAVVRLFGAQHVLVTIAAGIVAYALGLVVTGAVRLRRGSWPELAA